MKSSGQLCFICVLSEETESDSDDRFLSNSLLILPTGLLCSIRNQKSFSPLSWSTRPSMPRWTGWLASSTFRGPKTPTTCSTTGHTNSTLSCLWSTRPRISSPRRRWSTTCSETAAMQCIIFVLLLAHICFFFSPVWKCFWIYSIVMDCKGTVFQCCLVGKERAAREQHLSLFFLFLLSRISQTCEHARICILLS